MRNLQVKKDIAKLEKKEDWHGEDENIVKDVEADPRNNEPLAMNTAHDNPAEHHEITEKENCGTNNKDTEEDIHSRRNILLADNLLHICHQPGVFLHAANSPVIG